MSAGEKHQHGIKPRRPECHVSPAPFKSCAQKERRYHTLNAEMKQECSRVIGLDIHPGSFTAAIFERISLYHNESREVMTTGKIEMERLDEWLEKNMRGGDLFVVEAGSNTFHVTKKIKEHGGFAVVLESFRAGQIRKAYLKTDKTDARKIANIYMSGLAHEVWIPDEATLEQREIFFAYERATTDRTRTKNRIWGFLMKHGEKCPTFKELVKSVGKEKVLSKKEWTEQQKSLIDIMFEDLWAANTKKKELKRIMAIEVANNQDMLKLIRLFGISVITAYAVVAIIGDITRFANPKKLVAYIGLQPRVFKSGNGGFTGSVTHMGRRDLKSLLMEVAQAILRKGRDFPLALWGYKLTFRKAKNVAVCAVARKIVVAIWYLLRGFFTRLEEVSTTITAKLRKLSTFIGKEKLKCFGYSKTEYFIKAKERLLKLMT
jgi:transposase